MSDNKIYPVPAEVAAKALISDSQYQEMYRASIDEPEKFWAEKAEASGIHCLKQMAKTIRKRLDGLLAYWKHAKLTSASQEGFNNKIGWLTRQAYGYRDEKYLHLKIYDLPNLSTRRNL